MERKNHRMLPIESHRNGAVFVQQVLQQSQAKLGQTEVAAVATMNKYRPSRRVHRALPDNSLSLRILVVFAQRRCLNQRLLNCFAECMPDGNVCLLYMGCSSGRHYNDIIR